MTTISSGYNINAAQERARNLYLRNTGASATIDSDSVFNSSSSSSSQDDSLISDLFGDVGSGNTCTDGEDDGHIGPLSILGNIAQGAIRSITNVPKQIIKNPIKSLAFTALSFVPVAGPLILGGLALYGAVQSGREIINAAQVAASATTDAEAKAAWEHIGSGVTSLATTAIGVKKAVKAAKGQMKTSQTAYKVKNHKNFDWRDIGKTAINETAQNSAQFIKSTVSSVKNGISKVRNGVKNFTDRAQKGDFTGYVKDTAATIKNNIIDRYDNHRYSESEVNNVKHKRTDYQDAKKAYKEARKAGSSDVDTLRGEMNTARAELKTTKQNSTKRHVAIDSSKNLANNVGNEATKYENGMIKTQTYTDNGVEHKLEFNKSGYLIKDTQTLADGSIKTIRYDGTSAAGQSSVGHEVSSVTIASDGSFVKFTPTPSEYYGIGSLFTTLNAVRTSN